MSAIARGGGGERVHESVCISVLTRFRNNRSLFQIFLNAFRRGGARSCLQRRGFHWASRSLPISVPQSVNGGCRGAEQKKVELLDDLEPRSLLIEMYLPLPW